MNHSTGTGGAIHNDDGSDAGLVVHSRFNHDSCDDGATCGGAINDAVDGLELDNNVLVGVSPTDVTQ